MESVKIKILNEDKEFLLDKEKNLLEGLINAGVDIYADCGGEGICGKCKIRIISGNYITHSEHFISEIEKSQKIVLACKTFPLDNLTIEIPKESQIRKPKEISLYSETEKENLKKTIEKMSLDKTPLLEILDFKLPTPTIDTALSDYDRLLSFIKKNKSEPVFIDDVKILAELPKFLRKNNWEGQVMLSEKYFDEKTFFEIVELVKDKIKCYGLAIDIGTTTVAVSLVDIKEIESIITKTSFNKQMVFGEDVITRIIYSEKEDGLKNLNKKIIITLNEIINDICQMTKVHQKDIYAVVISGNTTMLHFFFNITATYIRKEPYIPATTKFPTIDAKDVGLMVNPKAKVYSIPLVASYVGGDVVGGVVACGIDTSEEVCVLVDLGTNGEIVVGNKEFLISAACSCGPAFEGVGITCGVKATDGAIEDIKITNGDVEYKTIRDKKPIGICGSGLIDIPAELFKAGLIDRSGKFIKDVNDKNLSKRIRKNEAGELEFLIEKKEQTDIDKDIVITQSDIQNILRSKGAIFHGVFTLLKYLNLKFTDIKKFFLSGNFGSFLNIKKAQILGLLPDIEEDKFIISGNTSLLGAKLFLVSKKARQRMFEVAKKMTYLDLSSFPSYMNEYASTLFIPHTDFSLFPNVMEYLKNSIK